MLVLNNYFTSRLLMSARSSIVSHQLHRQLQSLTPIFNHHQNFHLPKKSNNNNIRRFTTAWQTGLVKNSAILNSYQQQNNLQKCIHIQSTLNNKEKVEKGKIDVDDEDKNKKQDDVLDIDDKKLGLIARFKKMAKEYWYVLIPVHCFTSCFWFGGFYYTSVCGFDIVGLMESWNFSETLINPLRDSHLGHIAVAYLLYKIATPARYTVTLGGTTFAIKFLSKRGYLKPMPSKDKLVQMYKDKKEDIQQKVSDKKTEFTDKFRKN